KTPWTLASRSSLCDNDRPLALTTRGEPPPARRSSFARGFRLSPSQIVIRIAPESLGVDAQADSRNRTSCCSSRAWVRGAGDRHGVRAAYRRREPLRQQTTPSTLNGALPKEPTPRATPNALVV